MVGRYICSNCLKKVEYMEWQMCPVCKKRALDGITHPYCKSGYSLDGLYILGHYKGPLKSAIKLLKYKLVTDLTEELVSLVDINNLVLSKLDYITSVPLYPTRLRFRGFNQSDLLGKYLGKKLNIPYKNNILARIKNTKPQAELKRKERLTNLKGAFALQKNINIEGQNIGIVDDVSTTGTTLSECAKVLKSRSAREVWGIILAHGNWGVNML